MTKTKTAPKNRANGHALALWERLRAKREYIAITLITSGSISLVCGVLCLVACGLQDQGYKAGSGLLLFLGAGCPPDEVWALYLLFGLSAVVYGNQKLVQHRIDKRNEDLRRRWR